MKLLKLVVVSNHRISSRQTWADLEIVMAIEPRLT